jgi:hypothetical protein
LPSREENPVHLRPDSRCRCNFCGRTGEMVTHFPRRGYG